MAHIITCPYRQLEYDEQRSRDNICSENVNILFSCHLAIGAWALVPEASEDGASNLGGLVSISIVTCATALVMLCTVFVLLRAQQDYLLGRH